MEKQSMKEIWKEIPELNGYKISNFGKIKSFLKRRSLPKRGGSIMEIDQSLDGKTLKTRIDHNGYERIILRFNGKKMGKFVHVLVLEAFIGPRPWKMQCAHLNGKSLDNRLSNLKWCTQQENASHRLLHGTDMRGSKHPKAKLSKKEILEIRRLAIPYKVTYPMLAKEFGVSRSSIDKILSRRNWAHLK